MPNPTHCPSGHVYDEENTRWRARTNGSKFRECRACSRARYKRNAAYHTTYMRKWRAENTEHHHRTWSELRKKKKAWLDEHKRHNPCKCGESHPACLDFHHRDPSEKEGNLSEAIARWSMKKLQSEVAKCDIICSNCHRKLHWHERNS